MYKRGGLATCKENSVKAYIDAHLDERISMEPLYKLVGLSRGHFHKAFLATFGMNPGDYINRKRVEWACRWLEESNEPQAQIAHGCGYADQPHFIKRFRKVTGTTPKQWRMEYGHA